MKIQNDGSLGSAPLETVRTQATPYGAPGSVGAGQTISGQDGDSVAISGISARISEANAADGQQRASRVAQLTALHAGGSYQVNAAGLSSALVSQAVNTAPGGNS